MRASVVTGVALAVLGLAPAARAQSADQTRVAETLFQDGRALMASHDYAAACPKLEASEKAAPSSGTELNLADCYEKLGRTASAWAIFRDAIRTAETEHRDDRGKLARKRAAALEPHLAHMTVALKDASGGVEVRRNGKPIAQALLGSAEPVDPGTYTIEAVAPHKKAWSTSVEVKIEAAARVEVPPLEDDTSGAAAAAPTQAPAGTAASAPAASPTADADASPARPGSAQRTAAFVAAGVGVVAIGAGAYFGLSASSKWSDAKDACGPDTSACAPGSAQKADDARSAGNVATIAFVAGGVALAAAGVLWLTAPSSRPSEGPHHAQLRVAPTAGPSAAGLTAVGAF